MATRTVPLDIAIVADASDAAAAFDDVGAAARDMAADVDKASRGAADAAGRFDGAADGADNLASKSSQATGALGALSSGFELVGLEKYAGGLQAASLATDFFSGVGDAANLILESQAVQTVKNTALKAKDVVVTTAQTVATAALTAGQWLLNAAMSANPLALVLIAVVALVAILVVLYKRNETVRNIIQAVGRAAAAVFRGIINVVKDLVGWVRDRLGPAFRLWKDLVVGYLKLVTFPIRTLISVVLDLVGHVDDVPDAFRAAKDVAVGAVGDVVGKVGDLIGKARDLVSWVGDKVGGAFGDFEDAATAPLDAVTGAVDWLIDRVEDLVGWIADIHWPEPPGWLQDLGGFVGGIIPGIASDASGDDFQDVPWPGGVSQTRVINLTVNGAVDAWSSARQIRDLLRREDAWTGSVVIT